MSSNHNHISHTMITRDNYEEYFLLYVDDELTAEEKTAVEAFAALHPDLHEELQMLCSTKLSPGTFDAFENKESLLADSMKVNAFDESLLLYVDDELNAEAKKGVEEKMASEPAYRFQHELLQKTKLDPTEKIVYPHKEELYRRTERRITAYWWRYAAAAVLILWAGTTYWMDNKEDSSDNVPTVALQNTPPAQQAAEPAQKQPAVAAPVQQTKETSAPANTLAAQPAKKAFEKIKEEAPPATQQPTYTAENSAATVATALEPVAHRLNTVATLNTEKTKAQQQIINTVPVTSPLDIRSTNTTTVPVEDATASAAPNDKGGSVRGFFRKATRIIERSTSINPVNDDDELLIGAVSIKLK